MNMSNLILFQTSRIWSAYSDQCVGSKCGNPVAFENHLRTAIESHDTSSDRAPGQHFIVLSPEVVEGSAITAGVGLATSNVADHVLRLYRGSVKKFLKREHALPVAFCAAIVYTRDAYLADPEITPEYRAEIEAGWSRSRTGEYRHPPSHFLVALLANSAGVPSPAPRSPYRLLHCLAGGNNEAETWTLEELKEMAIASVEYAEEFSVVAD